MKLIVKEAKMAIGEGKDVELAYSMSKNFIEWYAQKCAEEYAAQGINVVCEEMRV